ncbi:MAG: YifB family Mg chelatase-like AAA ATPase [Vulcanococcus sp.]
MLARCSGAALIGLEAAAVAVEVDIAPGLPGLLMVGLPDAAVQESRERVRAAVRNSGLRMPLTRVIVNLAPADLRKEGPAFDLPIALAVLAASGQLDPAALAGVWCAGELGLDGQLRTVRGALAIALAARRAGARALLLPGANAAEASLVEELAVWPARDLGQALRWLLDPDGTRAALSASTTGTGRGGAANPAALHGQAARAAGIETCAEPPPLDLADVRGQIHGRRALEIAAAGGHHLLLVGPPGSGKTMLARRLAGLLPPLTRPEQLELTLLYSVAGLLPGSGEGLRLIDQRPFRSPHHSCSSAALVGGGSLPRPGELTLAHHGVLFLDELTEFRRDVLNQLRQPLEQGELWLSRARQRLRYPCAVSLVAATNPCPCGWYGDPERGCSCGTGLRQRYWSRLSGPLLDRLDLQVVVKRLEASELTSGSLRSGRSGQAPGGRPESSGAVAARVLAARRRMQARNPRGVGNGQLLGEALLRQSRLSGEALDLWQRAISQRRLSARAAERVLRVARTIADLDDQAAVGTREIAEALTYRSFDQAL